MSDTTVIRDADVVVAYDAERDRHVYLEKVDVAFRDGTIVHVGPGFSGDATVHEGRGRMILPGLVNVHAHPADEGLAKGVFDDTGTPALYGNALYEFGSLIEADETGVRACAEATPCDLALSGVTTVVDLSAPWPGWLDRLGVLDEHTLLGHAIFLDHHRWTRLRTSRDLAVLAERGASVAHCPVTFARSGMALESLGRYREAGVNVAIGTDSYPANMLEEMRFALTGARIAAGTVFDTDVGDVFRMATLAGARALGRDDIGRIAVGAKADLVAVDLTHPAMVPAHDPLRSLVLCAAERAVRDVWVDGRTVVTDGEMVTLDREGAARALAGSQSSALGRIKGLGRIAPRSLPDG